MSFTEAARTCRKCGDPKPLTEFPLTRGKRFFVCKACTDARVLEWTRKNRERSRNIKRASIERNPERTYLSKRKYLENNRDKVNASVAEWKRKNADKRACHTAVSNAIRLGKMQPQPCEICGNPRADGHHEDYSQPLKVMWLCRAHHQQLHRNRRAMEVSRG